MVGRTGALLAVLAFVTSTSCGGAPPAAPSPTATRPAAMADVIASGKIRVVIDQTSPVIGTKIGPNDYRGAGWDVAVELARRLGVTVEAVEADTADKVAKAATAGAWDIGVIVSNVDNDAAYGSAGVLVRVVRSVLVPAGTMWRPVTDVDKPGTRIAATSAMPGLDAMKNVRTIVVPSMDAAFDLVRSGQAEAMAGAKPRIAPYLERLPGSRILDGAYGYAMYGVYGPKDKVDRVAYLKDFVVSIKSSGFLQSAIDRSGAQGVLQAP